VDRIAMWVVDTIMAFPLFILAMGIVAALGSSMENIIYATAIVNVPFYARTVRAEINQRREAGFVEAARIAGNGSLRVLAYHLFPTAIPQLAVQMTLTMGWAMLNAASLSFIGLGIRPPTPEWGIMVAEGASFIITGEWWVALVPGLALVVVVLSLNLFGDGLRDMIDARERR
jgi:peptide/nickel transport system permease protein